MSTHTEPADTAQGWQSLSAALSTIAAQLSMAREGLDDLEARRDRLISSSHTAGATDQQIADSLGVSRQYVNKRRGELAAK